MKPDEIMYSVLTRTQDNGSLVYVLYEYGEEIAVFTKKEKAYFVCDVLNS